VLLAAACDGAPVDCGVDLASDVGCFRGRDQAPDFGCVSFERGAGVGVEQIEAVLLAAAAIADGAAASASGADSSASRTVPISRSASSVSSGRPNRVSSTAACVSSSEISVMPISFKLMRMRCR
jgi:hypothetical protein